MLIEAQEARRSGGAATVASERWTGVARLALTNFRNYREAKLVLGARLVVLIGPNGAGKTNLLEALSFLAPGRGLRGARLSEVDRRSVNGHDTLIEGSGWAVAAAIATRAGMVRIGTGRDREEGDRRIVRIDGEPARSQAALGEQLGVVWLTPQMDRLFVEHAAGRRRFLDRLVLALNPAHATRIGGYEQAMRERARLLRDGPADPGWLAAVEVIMAAQGVAIAAARRDIVQRLDTVCQDAETSFPRAGVALLGTIENWLDEMPALDAEVKFVAALADTRRNDSLTGFTGTGPHRSDLRISLSTTGMPAEFASTGEQKALLISIVLAHARLQRALRGEPPLLLLDEVAAHLDAGRRTALFEALGQLESQTWLTGTDEAVFAALRHRAQFLSVSDGTVT